MYIRNGRYGRLNEHCLYFLFLSRLARTEPEELAPDSLTCGVCRKEFPLAEIVRFIQHKVLSCNKENYRLRTGRPPNSEGGGEGVQSVDGSSSSEAGGIVCTRRPSISAPINARRLTPTVVDTSLVTVDDTAEAKTESSSSSASVVKTADAESNTVNSGKRKP